MATLIVLHGLPGVGKTTVCRELDERYPELFYADIGASSEMGEKPMFEICISLFGRAGPGQSLLTEGVLLKRRYRDKFIAEVIRGVKKTYQVDLVSPCVIYVNERDMDFLSTRRNRSVEDYLAMYNELETGSRDFDYVDYRTDSDERQDLEERLRRLESIITPQLR